MERRVALGSGSAEIEVEIGLSADPRGGLFGYGAAIDALPDPVRAAVVEGALAGRAQALAGGLLGPVDEVYVHAVRIDGEPDAAALREAVRSVVLELAAARTS